jgi:hypothetical protein
VAKKAAATAPEWDLGARWRGTERKGPQKVASIVVVVERPITWRCGPQASLTVRGRMRYCVLAAAADWQGPMIPQPVKGVTSASKGKQWLGGSKLGHLTGCLCLGLPVGRQLVALALPSCKVHSPVHKLPLCFALLSSHFQVKPTHSLHTTTDNLKLSRHVSCHWHCQWSESCCEPSPSTCPSSCTTLISTSSM